MRAQHAIHGYFRTVRSLLAFALVLAACSGGDRSTQTASQNASPTRTAREADALMLRVPRAGGVARATAYPEIDSVVWTGSDRVPPLSRVLAFDPEGGVVAAQGADGGALWIDLRVGSVAVPNQKGIRGLESADGQ